MWENAGVLILSEGGSTNNTQCVLEYVCKCVGRKGGGRMDETGIDVHRVQCVKQRADGSWLHSTGALPGALQWPEWEGKPKVTMERPYGCVWPGHFAVGGKPKPEGPYGCVWPGHFALVGKPKPEGPYGCVRPGHFAARHKLNTTPGNSCTPILKKTPGKKESIPGGNVDGGFHWMAFFSLFLFIM